MNFKGTYEDRKQHAAGLKPGSEVALRDRKVDTWGRRSGYTLYRVVKITPKRSRFDLQSWGGRDRSLSASEAIDLEPITNEILESIRADNAFLRAQTVLYKATEALESLLRKDFHLKSVDFHTALTEKLKVLMDFIDPKDPTSTEKKAE